MTKFTLYLLFHVTFNILYSAPDFLFAYFFFQLTYL